MKEYQYMKNEQSYWRTINRIFCYPDNKLSGFIWIYV